MRATLIVSTVAAAIITALIFMNRRPMPVEGTATKAAAVNVEELPRPLPPTKAVNAPAKSLAPPLITERDPIHPTVFFGEREVTHRNKNQG